MLRGFADSTASSGDEKLGSMRMDKHGQLRYHDDDVDEGEKAQLI